MPGARLLFAVALVALGFATGGFIAARMVPPGAMGWDGIAAALGGSVTGAVTGLFAAVLFSGKLSQRSALIAALAALVLAGALFAMRYLVPPG